MADKTKVKKTANYVFLSASRPRDVKALKNLADLRDAVPGLTDLTGTMRWLCEEEAPNIVEKYEIFKKKVKAS